MSLAHIISLVERVLICVAGRMKSWIDLALMFVTFVLTVLWSVEVGVIVSVTASLLLVVYKSSKAHIKILVSIAICITAISKTGNWVW